METVLKAMEQNAPEDDLQESTEAEWASMAVAMEKLTDGHLAERLLRADASFFAKFIIYHLMVEQLGINAVPANLTVARSSQNPDDYTFRTELKRAKTDGAEDTVEIAGRIQFLPDSETVSFLT